MNQRYLGPLSAVTLVGVSDGVESYFPGGSYVLFPGGDPGLPVGHPFTRTLIAEDRLILTEIPA